MVLFIAETYLLGEAGALAKLPTETDWVVQASLGVDSGDGRGEVAVDIPEHSHELGGSDAHPCCRQHGRVRVDPRTGALHLDLHTHSSNVTASAKP